MPRSLRLAGAQLLAREARAAFDARDATMFDGALSALVELVAAAEGRRHRS